MTQSATDLVLLPENAGRKEEIANLAAEEEITKHQTIETVIRQLRLKSKLSQGKLASGLGFRTPEYISMIETGLRTINLDCVPRAAQILGVNPRQLTMIALREYQPKAAAVLFGEPTGDKLKLPTSVDSTELEQLSPGGRKIGLSFDNLGAKHQNIVMGLVEVLLHADRRR